jgi:MFS family permease
MTESAPLPPLPRLRVAHLLLMTVAYFCSVGFLMQFPRDIIRLGGSAQDVGWLLALGLIPVLLLSRRVSEWNRQVGGRWPAVIGTLIVLTSNLLMLTVDHYGLWMISLRMLYAIGHTMIFGTLFAQAAFLVENPVQRASIIGWLAVMTQLGNAIGGTLGEIAFHHSSLAFWLGSACFILIAGVLGASWSLKPQTPSPVMPHAYHVQGGWPPEVWLIAAAAMAFAGVTQFLPAFVDHLILTGASEPFASSWFITSALLIVAAVRLVGGYYAAKLLRPAVLATCHVVLLVTLVLVPWMHTAYQAVILGIAFGISYGWLYPALNALAFNRVPPEARGKAAGWMVTAFECGFRLSPIGMGALVTYASYRAMFIGLAISYTVLLFIAWCIARKPSLITAAKAGA